MPLLALIALFLVVPFLELYVILEVVGPALGAPLTILLLAADSVIGALLLIPPTRSLVRRFVVRRLGRRLVVSAPGRSYDVEGSAREYDDAPGRRLER